MPSGLSAASRAARGARASGLPAGMLRPAGGAAARRAGAPAAHPVRAVRDYRHRDRSDGTSKSANLEEMVSAMAPYGAGQDALGAFLESVALANPADEAEQTGEEPKVTLITLHNTKGLEFDRVIISGLEEGIFPHDSSQLSAGGCGRGAQAVLCRHHPGSRAARHDLVPSAKDLRPDHRDAPSRFLDEIPKEQINHVESEAAAFLLGRGAGSEANDYPRGCGRLPRRVRHRRRGTNMVY